MHYPTNFFFFLNAGRYIQTCAAIPSEPHTHVHLPRRVLCLSSSVDLLADVVTVNSKIFRLPLAWIQSVYEYYEYLQTKQKNSPFSLSLLFSYLLFLNHLLVLDLPLILPLLFLPFCQIPLFLLKEVLKKSTKKN